MFEQTTLAALNAEQQQHDATVSMHIHRARRNVEHIRQDPCWSIVQAALKDLPVQPKSIVCYGLGRIDASMIRMLALESYDISYQLAFLVLLSELYHHCDVHY